MDDRPGSLSGRLDRVGEANMVGDSAHGQAGGDLASGADAPVVDTADRRVVARLLWASAVGMVPPTPPPTQLPPRRRRDRTSRVDIDPQTHVDASRPPVLRLRPPARISQRMSDCLGTKDPDDIED